LLLLLGATLTFCKKENVINPSASSNVDQNVEKLGQTTDYSSILLRYDAYGVWHNEAMEKVGQDIDIQNPNPALIYSILVDFISQKFPSVQLHSYDQYISMMNNARLNTNLNLDISAEMGVNYTQIQDIETLAMLADFQTMFNGLRNSDKMLTPDELSSKMLDFKIEIITNYGLPSLDNNHKANDVGMILIASSIAESSYRYWYSALYDQNSTWYGVFSVPGGDNSPAALKERWWDRFKADVRGFFHGGHEAQNGGGVTWTVGDASACADEYSSSI